MIAGSLHRQHQHDDLVRINPEALAVLHRLAQSRLAACAGPGFIRQLQDTLALAGYSFWASISLDFTDEHYHLSCPCCATGLVIVIGGYGCYSAIRDYNNGDIRRLPLHPATPQTLTGIGRWMHEAAVAGGDMTFADGLTYLFGRARCPTCGSMFPLADWFEAENSPTQPIDPIVPRSDRST